MTYVAAISFKGVAMEHEIELSKYWCPRGPEVRAQKWKSKNGCKERLAMIETHGSHLVSLANYYVSEFSFSETDSRPEINGNLYQLIKEIIFKINR